MKAAIWERARQLGFDHCRVTTAQPPESGPDFERWLAQGRQGEMAYLQRNAYKRVDPQRVLPGATSIIALAVSYAQGRGDAPPALGTRHPTLDTRHLLPDTRHLLPDTCVCSAVARPLQSAICK